MCMNEYNRYHGLNSRVSELYSSVRDFDFLISDSLELDFETPDLDLDLDLDLDFETSNLDDL